MNQLHFELTRTTGEVTPLASRIERVVSASRTDQISLWPSPPAETRALLYSALGQRLMKNFQLRQFLYGGNRRLELQAGGQDALDRYVEESGVGPTWPPGLLVSGTEQEGVLSCSDRDGMTWFLQFWGGDRTRGRANTYFDEIWSILRIF